MTITTTNISVSELEAQLAQTEADLKHHKQAVLTTARKAEELRTAIANAQAQAGKLDKVVADLQAKQGKLEEQLAQAEAHGNTIRAEALKSEIQTLQSVIASECANAV